jgi:hypothetical protein
MRKLVTGANMLPTSVTLIANERIVAECLMCASEQADNKWWTLSLPFENCVTSGVHNNRWSTRQIEDNAFVVMHWGIGLVRDVLKYPFWDAILQDLGVRRGRLTANHTHILQRTNILLPLSVFLPKKIPFVVTMGANHGDDFGHGVLLQEVFSHLGVVRYLHTILDTPLVIGLDPSFIRVKSDNHKYNLLVSQYQSSVVTMVNTYQVLMTLVQPAKCIKQYQGIRGVTNSPFWPCFWPSFFLFFTSKVHAILKVTLQENNKNIL